MIYKVTFKIYIIALNYLINTNNTIVNKNYQQEQLEDNYFEEKSDLTEMI